MGKNKVHAPAEEIADDTQVEDESYVDPDLEQAEEDLAVEPEQDVEDLRKQAVESAGAVIEKHRKENQEPLEGEEPIDPKAVAEPVAPASVADEDPEFEIGADYGKLKKSDLMNRLKFADQARGAGSQMQAEHQRQEKLKGLYADAGGFEKFLEVRKALGPHAQAFDTALEQFTAQFADSIRNNPASAAFAHQLSPMEKRIAQLEDQLGQERQMREQYFLSQQKQLITDRFAQQKRAVPSQVVDQLLEMARAQGMEPGKLMDVLYGPAQSATPAVANAPASTTGKPWDRAKAPINPGPRSVGPTPSTKGAEPSIDEMSVNELRKQAVLNARKVVRGFPRANLGQE